MHPAGGARGEGVLRSVNLVQSRPGAWRRVAAERGPIAAFGLFRPAAYRQAYGLRGIWARRPFLHYLLHGERQGFRPHPFFDPRHYAARLAEAGHAAEGSLLGHYVLHGAAAGIAPSAEFDPAWYAWEYMGGAAEPLPLRHFLAQGLAAGHRPSPGFDLPAWLAARGLEPAGAEAALLAELARDGRLSRPEVVDWEAGLLAAQARFRAAAVPRVVRRSLPRRRNLVLVQSGRDAALPWLAQPRDFDVLRNYYEEPGEAPCAGSEHVFVQRGTKMTAVAALLEQDPDLLYAYDHVLLLDDDIEIEAAGIDRLFREMQTHGLALAQPLLTPDSQSVWRVLRDPGNRDRIVPVTSVEVMMPAFSREALRDLAWTFRETVSGFGTDLLWGAALARARDEARIAVVGTVRARHARPIDEAGGAFYRFMAAQGISPRLELWRLMQRHGIRTELRALGADPASGRPGPTSMRIAAVSMIRNEADILPDFLRHCAALFDRMLVVEHCATDGSREILDAARAAGLPLSVWRLSSRAYQQEAVFNALVRRAFAEGADWVFVLDADEFLEVPGRAALEDLLLSCPAEVAEFRWRNVAPLTLGRFGAFAVAGEYAVATEPSPYGKVALSRRFAARRPGFWVAMGGHSVAEGWDGTPAPTARLGALRHVPVRGAERLTQKLRAGIAAFRALRGRDEALGAHWFEMARLLDAGALDEAATLRVALRYGEPLCDVLKSGRDIPARTEHWAPAQISLDLPAGIADPAVVSAHDARLRWRPSPRANDRWLMLDLSSEDAVLRPRVIDPDGNPGPESFAALPDEALPEPLRSCRFSAEQVAKLADLLCTPMRTQVPSAWAQHGPVMLALMELLRPRRYVELGSHHGYSFFAACQGAVAAGAGTECVAIDSWQGDEHASHYGNEVYETFTYLLGRDHPGPHFHIRALFDDALACFEPGSVDLLLIDGLHTLEAVTHDFETWLPKMSTRGVILFHDTTVLDRGFGVWKLWERISAEYPSYNLLHGHGLGMIYVGKPEPALAELLKALNEDAGRSLVTQRLLFGIGRLSESVSDLRRMLDAQTAQAKAAEAQRDAALARVHAIESSTSWVATAPLRRALGAYPGVRRLGRRSLKAAWWTLTGQLPARLRERRAAAAGSRSRAEPEPEPEPGGRANWLGTGEAAAARWPAPPPAPRAEAVDIVVCVHNAPQDVRRCLDSVLACTAQPYRIVIVDDGSAAETRDLLAAFAQEHGASLIRHDAAKGYTFAANAGLRAAEAPWVVLLNSDTIVTPGWLDRMVAHGRRDDRVGLVGPLSNTASWQSVPRLERNGDWAENRLPGDVDIAAMGALAAAASTGESIPLPFLNGFCLMLRADMLAEVGLFDEETFGAGYGEENDLCIRARNAGWKLVCAPDAYVFHAQSRSYSHDRRLALARRADEALARKHDPARDILPQVALCRASLSMAGTRARIAAAVERARLHRAGRSRWGGHRVAFVLPVASEGGGCNVVLQEAAALARMGVEVALVNLAAHRAGFEASYPDCPFPVHYAREEAEVAELIAGTAGRYDAAVATLYKSVAWLPPADAGCRLGYYVQDFEPLFFAPEDPENARALNSYTQRPEVRAFTKTRWNAAQVERATGLAVPVVGPSVNIDLFRPLPARDAAALRDGPVRVVAMVRPSSPRRAPGLTCRVLAALHRRFRGDVRIAAFGADDDELKKYRLSLPAGAVNLGRLKRPETAALLARADVFLDLSEYQAMGLTALEAMASGCAVIVPARGGAVEFAVHEDNALVADTSSERACIAAAARLVGDATLRRHLRSRAVAHACTFHPEAAAARIMEVLFEGAATARLPDGPRRAA